MAATVLRESRGQQAKKVLSIDIEIGELTFLNPQQVKFWLREILRGTLAENAEVHIRKIRSYVRCSDCGWRGRVNDKGDPLCHTYLFYPRCSRCGSVSLEVESGRECRVKRIRASL